MSSKQQRKSKRGRPKGRPQGAPGKPSSRAKSGTRNGSSNTKYSITKNTTQVCAITDPFCHHALGSKYPDTSGVRTLAYPLHITQSFTCDANGDASILVFPAYGVYPLKQANIINATVAQFTTDFVAYAPIAQVFKYRNVSYGIRIRNTTAPLASSGMVRIRTFGDVATSAFLAVDRASYACDSYLDIPLQDCHDVAVVGRKVGAESNLYQNWPPGLAVATMPVTQWGPIIVDVAGGPANASISIELFLHQEYVLDDTNGLQLLATAPPPSNKLVVAVSEKIQSSGNNIFKNGVDAASRFIENAAERAMMGLLQGAVSTLLLV